MIEAIRDIRASMEKMYADAGEWPAKLIVSGDGLEWLRKNTQRIEGEIPYGLCSVSVHVSPFISGLEWVLKMTDGSFMSGMLESPARETPTSADPTP